MNYQNIELKKNSNQMVKLVPIFSILFVSMFFVAIFIAGDKEAVIAKSNAEVPVLDAEHSLTAVSEIGIKDPVTYSHISTEEPKSIKQSGTGSSISNYVNAWKLSKATSVSQIIV